VRVLLEYAKVINHRQLPIIVRPFICGVSLAPPDQKLRAYGLFKQVTAGDCTAERPGFFDMVGGAKW
jgi:hypothetical protein